MYSENDFDSTYEELLTFYPSFYRDIYEMTEILKVFGKAADNLISGIDGVINNNFIMTADSETVSKIEEIVGIETDESISLNERRKRCLSYFTGFGKMSASKIKEIISVYTGADCEVVFSDDGVINITAERGDTLQLRLNDILSLLDKRMPAHLMYTVQLYYNYPVICKYSRKYYRLDAVPNCGASFCGQEIMFV